MKQATIQHSFSLRGKGLHTGLDIQVTVCPADVNTGVRICRTDLPERPTYEALSQYVSQTTRGTVLAQGKWRVSTVEHLLSALYALGVTNCLIELDAPEVPILDGSALPWVEAIMQAGIVEQDAEAKEWVITEPIAIDNGRGSRLALMPSDHFEVEVYIEYPSSVLSHQTAQLPDLSLYTAEIAPARTFCFLREIYMLLSIGLIKGGDLHNAVVIYDRPMAQWRMNRLARKLHQEPVNAHNLGYLTPLHFDNEPARHKLLDLVGDLSLIGCRIRGKIAAELPGHEFNTYCAKRISGELVK